jgi:2,6-dihydroxypyridine 3-monooxygenase
MTDYASASAVVVGDSIGGLTTASLLRDLGFAVDVYERTPTALDGRGGGIVLQPDTVRFIRSGPPIEPSLLGRSRSMDCANSLVVQRLRSVLAYG